MPKNAHVSAGFEDGSGKSAGVSVERRIVYYPGCVVDYFDLKTGQAVVQILEKVGCTVEIPDLIYCRFPLLNSGGFRLARKRAAELTKVLWDFVNAGFHAVYSCPTRGHALKETYPKLVNSGRARVVAENTHSISRYLLALLGDGERELEFNDNALHVAYHTSCHLRFHNLSFGVLSGSSPTCVSHTRSRCPLR